MILPSVLDVTKLRAGGSVSGVLSGTSFKRLPADIKISGNPLVRLLFEKKDGTHYINGIVEGNFIGQCQRCLEKLTFSKKTSFRAIIEENMRSQVAAEDHSILLCENGTIQLHRLVEDEILLVLPMAPKHLNYSCAELLGHKAEGEYPLMEDKQTPFENLKTLMKEKKNQI